MLAHGVLIIDISIMFYMKRSCLVTALRTSRVKTRTQELTIAETNQAVSSTCNADLSQLKFPLVEQSFLSFDQHKRKTHENFSRTSPCALVSLGRTTLNHAHNIQQ